METTVSIFGGAAAEDTVITLHLDGDLVTTTNVNHSRANPERAWIASLPPQPKSGSPRTLIASNGKGTNVSIEVRFGVVVLCSGQSNMGMSVGYYGPHMLPQPPHFWGTKNKTSFSADGGAAETAASSEYTGKVFLFQQNPIVAAVGETQTPLGGQPNATGKIWQPVVPSSLGHFSALCWYAGKHLYEARLRESGTPLGLILAAVGGSPIEFWVPPIDLSDHDKMPCYEDKPQCDNSGGKADTQFWQEYMEPIVPMTISALVWDQAERDVKCPLSLANYGCMQKYLISSWRKALNSTFAFVGVQLAGYTAAIKNGTGSYPGNIPSSWVYNMRLQQEAGCAGVEGGCAVIPTYDVSCQATVLAGCPYGSVHQPHKSLIGARVGAVLNDLLIAPDLPVKNGPRAVSAKIVSARLAAHDGEDTVHTIEVIFEGSTPFAFIPTRNCTAFGPGYCCDGRANNGHTVDFDASSDGKEWINGTNSTLVAGDIVHFVVVANRAPTTVRYTAASIWPQCAIVGAEGLPAFPFELKVSALGMY